MCLCVSVGVCVYVPVFVCVPVCVCVCLCVCVCVYVYVFVCVWPISAKNIFHSLMTSSLSSSNSQSSFFSIFIFFVAFYSQALSRYAFVLSEIGQARRALDQIDGALVLSPNNEELLAQVDGGETAVWMLL